MRKKLLVILLILVPIILILGIIYNSNPSEEKIREGIVEKDKIRENLQNVINGVENPNENYQISITEAREKAIIIFNSLGEKNLDKDNVEVIEINRDGNKHYYIRSAKNSVEIEIKTGKVININNVIQ